MRYKPEIIESRKVSITINKWKEIDIFSLYGCKNFALRKQNVKADKKVLSLENNCIYVPIFFALTAVLTSSRDLQLLHTLRYYASLAQKLYFVEAIFLK